MALWCQLRRHWSCIVGTSRWSSCAGQWNFLRINVEWVKYLQSTVRAAQHSHLPRLSAGKLSPLRSKSSRYLNNTRCSSLPKLFASSLHCTIALYRLSSLYSSIRKSSYFCLAWVAALRSSFSVLTSAAWLRRVARIWALPNMASRHVTVDLKLWFGDFASWDNFYQANK